MADEWAQKYSDGKTKSFLFIQEYSQYGEYHTIRDYTRPQTEHKPLVLNLELMVST